jgi:hypothetical protein
MPGRCNGLLVASNCLSFRHHKEIAFVPTEQVVPLLDWAERPIKLISKLRSTQSSGEIHKRVRVTRASLFLVMHGRTRPHRRRQIADGRCTTSQGGLAHVCPFRPEIAGSDARPNHLSESVTMNQSALAMLGDDSDIG